MKIGKLTAVALLTAASAGFSAPTFAAPYVDIRVAPPPPRVEAVPAPRRGYAWVPGYWDWRGRRHVWVSGNWVRERPGYVYSHPTWVQEGDHWRFNRGAWARGGRDRDRDGVPNRMDRDRDGDGVPNNRDRHPNNPNRG
jgi:hypothetical protein